MLIKKSNTGGFTAPGFLRLNLRRKQFGLLANLARALPLQTVQIVGGALRVGGCGEDRAFVVLQDLEPCCEIGGMIFPRVRRDGEIGAQESRPHLGDQFFKRIGMITETLAELATLVVTSSVNLRKLGRIQLLVLKK